MEKRLYKIKTRGLQINSFPRIHGIAYVVAEDPTEAYNKLRRYLDEEDLGYKKDRDLESIEVIAEEDKYGDTPYQLFL